MTQKGDAANADISFFYLEQNGKAKNSQARRANPDEGFSATQHPVIYRLQRYAA
jgi:hypothetical protein